MMTTRRARFLRTLAIPATLGALVIGGFSVGIALAEDSPTASVPSSDNIGTTGQVEGVNEAGQTYGTAGGSAPTSVLLDLIEVVATNGLVGYVDRGLLDSLTGADVSSPDEAVAWMKEMDSATWETKTIPVYLLDGVTEIGEFVISRGEGEDTVG